MEYQVGDEVLYRRGRNSCLGIVTAVSNGMVYVLFGQGICVMGTEPEYIKATGVHYGDFAEALGCLKERHLKVVGKLTGWRDIMPRESLVEDDVNAN